MITNKSNHYCPINARKQLNTKNYKYQAPVLKLGRIKLFIKSL